MFHFSTMLSVFNHKYLAMAKSMCMLVLLTRVYLATSEGLYQDFVMITDLSNKVLKNSWKEVSQSFSRSLLDCSTQCGRCCGCFGFNTLTKVCRVLKTCDKADVTEHEEGWTYHYLRDLHEKGEFRSTVQLESTLSSSHTSRNGDVPFILFFPLLVNTFPVYK